MIQGLETVRTALTVVNFVQEWMWTWAIIPVDEKHRFVREQ